jgi:hypothetical protein
VACAWPNCLSSASTQRHVLSLPIGTHTHTHTHTHAHTHTQMKAHTYKHVQTLTLACSSQELHGCASAAIPAWPKCPPFWPAAPLCLSAWTPQSLTLTCRRSSNFRCVCVFVDVWIQEFVCMLCVCVFKYMRVCLLCAIGMQIIKQCHCPACCIRVNSQV